MLTCRIKRMVLQVSMGACFPLGVLFSKHCLILISINLPSIEIYANINLELQISSFVTKMLAGGEIMRVEKNIESESLSFFLFL